MEPTRETRPRLVYGRPPDTSLPAYKYCVLGMTLALNPDAQDDMSEPFIVAPRRDALCLRAHYSISQSFLGRCRNAPI
jgi:hypothetical protein